MNNILHNGDFEDSNDHGWMSSVNNTQINPEGEKVTNHFAKIPETQSIYRDISLSKNTKYRVKISSRGSVSGVVSFIDIEEKTFYQFIINSSHNNVWGEELFELSTDSKADKVNEFHIEASWSSNGGAHLDVDNISVEAVN